MPKYLVETPKIINTLIEGMGEMVTRSVGEAVKIELDLAEDLWNCRVDPTQAEVALLNVLLNARDAIAGPGGIKLQVTTVQNTWLDVTVSDTGPGFSDHVRSHAFDPFFTTKGGEGSGLGLTMVYNMTKLAGGRVMIDNTDTGGRLEMDSTANYTAAVTNIDLSGDAYKADNEWNTYRYKGLPPTPIAAVGVPALEAMLDPAPGGWLYFVTVDTAGTTLFANTFEDHIRNRQVACRNKLVATGCSQ